MQTRSCSVLINFPGKSTLPLFSFWMRLDQQLQRHRPSCFSPLAVLKLISDVMRLFTATTPTPRPTSEPLHGALSATSTADGVDRDRGVDGHKWDRNKSSSRGPGVALPHWSMRKKQNPHVRKISEREVNSATSRGEKHLLWIFPRRGNFLRQPHQLEKGEQPQLHGSLQRQAKGVFANVVVAKRSKRFVGIFPLITCKCEVYKSLEMMLNCWSCALAYYHIHCKILIIQKQIKFIE